MSQESSVQLIALVSQCTNMYPELME